MVSEIEQIQETCHTAAQSAKGGKAWGGGGKKKKRVKETATQGRGCVKEEREELDSRKKRERKTR